MGSFNQVRNIFQGLQTLMPISVTNMTVIIKIQNSPFKSFYVDGSSVMHMTFCHTIAMSNLKSYSSLKEKISILSD